MLDLIRLAENRPELTPIMADDDNVEADISAMLDFVECDGSAGLDWARELLCWRRLPEMVEVRPELAAFASLEDDLKAENEFVVKLGCFVALKRDDMLT